VSVIPALPNEESSPSIEMGECKGRDEIEGPPGGFGLAQMDMEVMEDGDDAGFLGDRLLLYSFDTRNSRRRMMVFQGSVNGHQAVILLDLGADANFVSQRWADHTGIIQQTLSRSAEVTTATGQAYVATVQLFNTDVRVVGKTVKSSLVVVPLGTYDVILGTPWFEQTQPVFDWLLWTCNGHSVYSKGGHSYGHLGKNDRRLQSVSVVGKSASRMRALLVKYASVFATSLPNRVVNKDAMIHSFLMTEGAVPIRDGERRRSPEELRLAREMVREGESSGIIEDSTSEWCSQLVMVVKKDQHGMPTGKPRFCVDYRRVNALMRKDSHPLPLPESMFAQLHLST
jgi:hypothetical protein